MTEQEILNRAINALNANLHPQEAKVVYDGNIPYLTVMGRRFVCIIEPNLTPCRLMDKIPDKSKQPNKAVKYLYVTVNATPKVMAMAKHPDINVMDCAGNFNIQYQLQNGNIVLMLANKGEKPIVDTTPKAYPIFLEKGLEVIFYFLMDKRNIKRPYREIVDATGVAIGTVKNIIDGMIYQQFARVENHKRILTNIDRLLMLWAAGYGQILKPKLERARFAFRDEQKRNHWKDIKLPEGMLWGGESAAALTDGFLSPGEFTVYTDIPAANLMKTGDVIPDMNGDIIVYQKFWKGEGDSKITPAILTYADLMDTANGRCIEAAQKIKENELSYLL